MGLQERRKHSKKVNIAIAVMLALFAFLTYIMTFVIVHLWRNQ